MMSKRFKRKELLALAITAVILLASAARQAQARHIRSLRVVPAAMTVFQGGSPTFTVYLAATEGVTAYVQLQVADLPRMAVANFTPNPVLIQCSENQICPEVTSVLLIQLAKNTKPDNYTIMITADPELQKLEAYVALQVMPKPAFTFASNPVWPCASLPWLLLLTVTSSMLRRLGRQNESLLLEERLKHKSETAHAEGLSRTRISQLRR